MSCDGQGSYAESDILFASIYNDIERFPNLTDVALELDISYQTVRNKSSILKGKARRGENVPPLISRVVVAKEKETVPPQAHAQKRADYLLEEITRLITKSRYPVTNPEAVVVEPNISIKYDRLTGENKEIENTPRTWLSDTLRVEPVEDPRGRRFIMTGAQNDTVVDLDFWKNLLAYAEYLDADILVGPGTYETQWWAENNPAVRAYAPEIEEYLCFGRMDIGSNFAFCGEMNMLPTANRPIGDLATYSQGKWTVFPHAKIQLKSVASLDPSKQAHQVMTTGMVTKPKVIPRKAGIKALNHHRIGAVVVEFDQDGDLFCRHITAGPSGAFYDLDVFVADGKVAYHSGVRSITMGDAHMRKMDWRNSVATIGFDMRTRMNAADPEKVLAWRLAPAEIVLHDIFDNETRNHHHVGDNSMSYELAYAGKESVLSEVKEVADFLRLLNNQFAVTVVESNHDIALERYVREGRYRNDGINIRFGLQLEDAYLAWREKVADARVFNQPVESFSLLEYAVNMVAEKEDYEFDRLVWVHDGKSYMIDDVEAGHHGFRGANGARGTVAGYAQLGRKMTIGDKHTPEILDDVYVAGCMNLRHGYNKGPSGWAVAHVIQYQDGNRAIVTLQNGKWRAF